MDINPPEGTKMIGNYIRLSVPYLVYLILFLIFFMWSDLSGKQRDAARVNREQTKIMEGKIAQLQTSMAVNQATSQMVMKMIDKVDTLEARLTREETILELHREESTYDKFKKFPGKSRVVP